MLNDRQFAAARNLMTARVEGQVYPYSWRGLRGAPSAKVEPVFKSMRSLSIAPIRVKH